MTQEKHRSVRQKGIAAFLASRCFSREFKTYILGADNQHREQFVRFENELRKKIDWTISEATWHKWWTGRTRPNANALMHIENHFPELVAKWFELDSKDRLARHINALDFPWLAKNKSVEESYVSAYIILERIHEEWSPGIVGVLAIPGPEERCGVNWRNARYRAKSAHLFEFDDDVDVRQKIKIGSVIGPPSELQKRVGKSAQYHESANPFSSLAFMLSYAVETRLPDPGLKLAFVLDFMTVVLAALQIFIITSPESVIKNGRPARICMAAREFFWFEHVDDWNHDPLWQFNNAFTRCFEPVIGELLGEYDELDTWDLFFELRQEYFDALKLTGMAMKKLQHHFQEFAEPGLSP